MSSDALRLQATRREKQLTGLQLFQHDCAGLFPSKLRRCQFPVEHYTSLLYISNTQYHSFSFNTFCICYFDTLSHHVLYL